MEEELNLDNILTGDDINNLFVDNVTTTQDSSPEKEENEHKEETTEADPDNLFIEGQPESVGSGKENTEGQEDASSTKESISPNNFYSSIAKALEEEGIFPDLDTDTISKVTDPASFRDLVEQQIQAGLDERQKRIDEALNAGVETSEIRKYEGTIQYLNTINEEAINAEDEQGEELRRRLIAQDLINRGYRKDKIERELKKSFDAGSDIEDAKEALESNRTFFRDKYNTIIKEAQEEAKKEEQDRKAQAEKLKDSILNGKNVFGDLEIDNNTRHKIYDSITKPIYKDPDTGEYYTAIQKYELDNRSEFLKNVALVFTLTDGFKNIDGLIKGKVKKEVKKGLKELENTLNNTARTSDGSLNFASGTMDENSYFNSLSLDL